jgi:membrane-bound metal-dependent hydrolase YbcI (DUF457 family)
MRGHTHALFGLTTVTAANALTGFVQPHVIKGVPAGFAICAGAAILGALLPDIDAEDSAIKREMRAAGALTSLGLRLFGVEHRGLTHSGVITLLVIAAGWLLGREVGFGDVGLAFGLGYFSHVAIADAMTRHGVPLWWPLPGRFYLLPKALRIKTGSPAEALVFMLIGAGLVWIGQNMTPPGLLRALH